MASLLKNVAPVFSASTSYSEGDFVLFSGKLYRANENTTGVFDTSKWTEVFLTDLISGNLGDRFVYGVADIGSVITLPFTPEHVMIWNPKFETNARIEIYDNGKSYHNDIDNTTAFSSGMSWSKLNGNIITIGKHSKESCAQKTYIAWK